jgi:Gpi18-like mannosyltransferase
MFCCGGYKFQKVLDYLENFNELKKLNLYKKEIYISHVIQRMISKKKIFSYQVIPNYIEVGTLNEWNDYNNKPCFFVILMEQLFTHNLSKTIQKNQHH